MKKTPLTSKPHYTDFVNARDRALERILHHHLTALDILMAKTKKKVLAMALHHPDLIWRELAFTAHQMTRIVSRLRVATHALAYHGEARALYGVFGKAVTKHHHLADEMASGGSAEARVHLAMSRLARKIEDALQLSKVLGETSVEAGARLARAFPPTRPAPKTTAALQPRKKRTKLHEADTGFRKDSKADIITAEDWAEILDDYHSEELPEDIFARGPDDKVVFFDADDTATGERYSWELEQEATETFVRDVRAGAIDAANDNGIYDFLWNAVIDGKTDECCSVRDGLTSAEIEAKLEQGPIDEDGCEAIVAPAHFNCRCKSVPISDSVPDQPPPDFEGFDAWLESKAKGE